MLMEVNPLKTPISRVYVCLDACRIGLLARCRRTIGLDGCFLRWPWRGELLFTVGKDANNQMYPITWVVVEVVYADSWTWFLSNLSDNLRLRDVSGMSIISAQQ